MDIPNLKHFLIIKYNRHPVKGKSQINAKIQVAKFDGKAIFAGELRGRESNSTITFPAVCGDKQDYDHQNPQYLGNGILIQELRDGSLEVRSSLTGLPPLYMYQDASITVVSDNIGSISGLEQTHLKLSPLAAVELAKIGKPINYRTLFKEIRVIPAGSRIFISENDVKVFESEWRPTAPGPIDSWDEYIDNMVEYFNAAIHRLDTAASFLSLTGGLDTRAVISSLAKYGKLIPSYTITGSVSTLDALHASRLSKAYGIEHTLVTIDDSFKSQLPEFTEKASLLSGGLSSLGQATEIYFYKMVGSDYQARISGNLGNQIGRSGTEGTSTRNSTLLNFSSNIRSELINWNDQHWFFKCTNSENLLSPEFLITKENLFAQIDNYSIGHDYATQQTPYADNRMINLKYREPSDTNNNITDIKSLRYRDLKHRILGQSTKHSFQCKNIQNNGGFAACYPINWGWKIDGGISIEGVYNGLKAFTDIVSSKTISNIPVADKLLQALGIKGFADFKTSNILYEKNMQSFVKDNLLSKTALDSGIFDNTRLQNLCNEKIFNDPINYDEILTSLDLTLAMKNFNASL